MITDDHRAKAREIVQRNKGWGSVFPYLEDEIAQALAEQQEKDARIAEGWIEEEFCGSLDGRHIAAAIRAGGV